MGVFGLVGLLCGRTDSGRRADGDGMARNVREDPGDSDAHLLAAVSYTHLTLPTKA